MLFNPDPKKQAQELMFSRKRVKDTHRSAFFNNAVVEQSPCQKHLDICLDEICFISKRCLYQRDAYIKVKINKTKRGIGLIRKVQIELPRNVLLTIHKTPFRLW